jgi:hypothetical protein
MTVYFIGCGYDRVKIGYTNHPTPDSRLADLQAGSPLPLEILAWCDGDEDTERAIHRELADERTHREWFKITPRVAALIAVVRKTQALGKWRAVLNEPDQAVAFAAEFQTIEGFPGLAHLPAEAIRFDLETRKAAAPPQSVREMRSLDWEEVVSLWPTQDSDAQHIEHTIVDTGPYWDFGWQRRGDRFVDCYGRVGLRRTAELLTLACGNREAEAAVWIQACLLELRKLDPISARRRLPCVMDLGRAANEVVRCDWHHKSTIVLPDDMFIPERCVLDEYDFVRLVRERRARVWAEYTLRAAWLDGASENLAARRASAA